MIKLIYIIESYFLCGNHKRINAYKEYVDKMTGKIKERPMLNKMIVELKEGDTVYCESISRLGRSLKDLIDIIEQLVNKGGRVVIVKEGIDTSIIIYIIKSIYDCMCFFNMY